MNMVKLESLEPGYSFRYHGTDFVIIDLKPSTIFTSASYRDEVVCALNLTTFKVSCFTHNFEVVPLGSFKEL